ncbi:MAG: response regulator [Lachnospiraceae bacterium]|jgi:signal transduction histidine kinase/DNA-binding response OmpR family regulator|nr:response regulator [Lachnospiraceae bacterium]
MDMKRQILKIMPPLLFTVTILLMVLYQYREQNATERSSGSPFYQNLSEAPAYAKRGFDRGGLLTVPVEGVNGWVRFAYPPYRIIDSGLPGLPERPFLSPWGRATEEFTIALLFELDEQTMKQIREQQGMAGIFLACIGENWEIYLNGELVQAQMHVDGAGEILSRRTWRDVYYPIETYLFRRGTNILTLRIVGDPAYNATGLYYASRNYIDDYWTIEDRQHDAFLVALCGIFAFAGFYYISLFLSIRKKAELFNLYFSFFSYLLCLYALVRNSLVNSLIPNSDITIRLEYAAVFLLLPVFGLFIESLGWKRVTKPTWFFLVFCALLAILQIPFSAQFGDEILALWNIAVLVYMTYMVVYDVVIYYLRHRRQGSGEDYDGHFGNILFGLVLVYVCGLYDLANVVLFAAPVSIFVYSVAVLHIGVTFSLSQRFASLYRRLQAANERLETAVIERTAELEKQTIAAVRASQAKSDFLADMSHEIRTPMNAIIGIAQISLQRADLAAWQKEALERIYNAGSSLLGIINSILDLSKIEAGNLELNPAEYELPSLINDVAQINAIRIAGKPIEFLIDADEKLPFRLYGDELRLKQILNNLVSNAIKYTAAGYVKLAVSHSGAGEDVMLSLRVEDSGQGLKPEDKERLFSKYLRFNIEENRSTEGTGIGLTITKSLVQMMEGTITVESEYGQGSVFTVTVRQRALADETIGPECSQRLRNFSLADERHKRGLQITHKPLPEAKVLVVDDVETNLYVAEGLLAPYQMHVETVASGFEAIEKIGAGGSYDIVFMDHMMPLMDGLETTRKIRELGYKGVIVALTANALVGAAEMFKQDGFDDFISKPIDVKQLDDCLNRYIQRPGPNGTSGANGARAPQASADAKAKLLEGFCRDAAKAVVTLRETVVSGDNQLFATAAHGMKSALANVGEFALSEAAALLEKAAREKDREYIITHVEAFVSELTELVNKLTPTATEADAEAESDKGIVEDRAYLAEQLRLIVAACEGYDDTAAYAALDRLGKKTWKKATEKTLKEIRNELFANSDFEAAGQRAGELLE